MDPSELQKNDSTNPYQAPIANEDRIPKRLVDSVWRRLFFSGLMAFCGLLFGSLSAIGFFSMLDTLKSASLSANEYGMLLFMAFSLALCYVCLSFSWRFFTSSPYRNGLYFSTLAIALFGIGGCIALVVIAVSWIAFFVRLWFAP